MNSTNTTTMKTHDLKKRSRAWLGWCWAPNGESCRVRVAAPDLREAETRVLATAALYLRCGAAEIQVPKVAEVAR
jgi:hypothetical protein